MGGAAAVGIHDDLPAGETAVTLRATNDEAACGIDVDLGVLVHQLSGNRGLDDQFDHIPADLIQRCLGGMLGGDHHGIHTGGLAILVILHRHLRLAVGAQVIHQLFLTDLRQALGHLLGQGDRQRH